MTYHETIQYLYTQLPMYQRVGQSAFKKDLTNIRKLLMILGQPHESFPTIHVAGTNGKGSVSHILSAILQAHGYRVGLYTSPHYKDFRERIKINGKYISKNAITSFVEKNRSDWSAVQPSFFEITVAMAFQHFADEQVDIAVIETGLGGRLDSTNVISPLMSVITNIGYDHMDMLGNTLPKIAFEKAGIIKKHVPVVVGEYHRDTAPVFKKKAKSVNAPIVFADRTFRKMDIVHGKTFDHYSIETVNSSSSYHFKTDIQGPFQSNNIRTAIAAMDVFSKSNPDWKLSKTKMKAGLAHVIPTSLFMGRWQYLSRQPDVLCDSGHNLHALKSIVKRIKELKHPVKRFVLGFSSGKDVEKMISEFPDDGIFYFAKPNVPRGLPVSDYIEILKRKEIVFMAFKTVKAALNAARRDASKKDLIFVGGSTFVVAEIL